MPSAQFIQKLMAKTRRDQGGRVVIAGQSYPMTTRSLEPNEHEYLPENLTNAASAELRLFCVTPTDFPIWPALGSRATWAGTDYTIIAVRPGDDVIGDVYMKLELYVYRTPEEASATVETPQEAADSGHPEDAGKRKRY